MAQCKQSACPVCEGAGGYYWDAPVYHNERHREWASCHNCIPDRYWRQYELEKGPFQKAKD